jgi:hypothetical protein
MEMKLHLKSRIFEASRMLAQLNRDERTAVDRAKVFIRDNLTLH